MHNNKEDHNKDGYNKDDHNKTYNHTYSHNHSTLWKNPSLISTRTHKLTRTTFSTTADDELGLQNHFNSFSRSLH